MPDNTKGRVTIRYCRRFKFHARILRSWGDGWMTTSKRKMAEKREDLQGFDELRLLDPGGKGGSISHVKDWESVQQKASKKERCY